MYKANAEMRRQAIWKNLIKQRKLKGKKLKTKSVLEIKKYFSDILVGEDLVLDWHRGTRCCIVLNGAGISEP